jgi:hypothetical protein
MFWCEQGSQPESGMGMKMSDGMPAVISQAGVIDD